MNFHNVEYAVMAHRAHDRIYTIVKRQTMDGPIYFTEGKDRYGNVNLSAIATKNDFHTAYKVFTHEIRSYNRFCTTKQALTQIFI